MTFVPGGDIDFDPVEHQEIELSGRMIIYDARVGKCIKDAWYVAFYVTYPGKGNKPMCVYGLLTDRSHYTYACEGDSNQIKIF